MRFYLTQSSIEIESALLWHRTKFEESVNGNVVETCENVPETRRIIRVSVSGFVAFTRVSVAAYTEEPDHFFGLVSVKETEGNKCFRNRNSGFTIAETHENVAEICLFHVSVDVFRTTECVMEPAETQEIVRETEVCFMFPLLAYVSETCYFKIIFHLRKLF